MSRYLTILVLALTINFAAKAKADDVPVVPPPATPPQQTVAPVTPPATPATQKSIVNNSNTKLPEPKVEVVQPPPEFDKTMMFNEDTLKAYKDAYDAYVEKLKFKASKSAVEDKIGDLAGKLSDDKLLPAPVGIYLNSILYRTDMEGVAWINEVKYKVNGINDNVKLVGLNQNNATILWKTANYDIDFKAWADIFPSSSDNNPDLSKLPANRQNIRVDSSAKNIIFTLRPNQSLDIANMAIKEGKTIAAPKAAETKPADEKPAATPGDVSKLLQKAREAVQDEVPQVQPKIAAPVPPPIDPSADKTATFHLSVDGHFNVPAKLNDRSITFKVDTGATITAISSEDAVKLGIDVTKLDYKYDVTIADGTKVKAAEANIENFTIDAIQLHNINVLIAQGAMAQPLLGMSFFGKLKKFTIEGDTLTLYQ